MAKHRSPSYPNLTIEDALKTAQTLYDKEKRHPVPVEVIAKHAGYADIKSSSALRLIASLNHYGLVVETGAGEDRKMKLSDRALDIILAESPDSPKRLATIREAASAPAIHQRILKQFPEQLPSIPTLKNFLIRDLDFNDAQVDTFINKFIKTVDFAGLYSDNGGGGKIEVGSYVQQITGGKAQFNSPVEVEGISEDGEWVFIDKELAVPMSELVLVDPPEPMQQETQPPRRSVGIPPVNPKFKPPKQPDGPVITFPLSGGNVVELRLASRVSRKDFERLKKLIDLSEDSLVEEDDDE